MMPSSSSDLTAPNCSSRGTLGSMRCRCQSPICSTPSCLQLLSACLRSHSGRPSISHTLGPGALEPSLGGDQNAAIRMERLADELLGHVGPVRIGGIDEVDAERRQALQRADGLGLVFRRTPNAFSGDAHGAETKAMDLDLAADLERP